MANQLDLEEQEQLDQLKHFWKQYGSPITWILILVLTAFAGWNFYQYWQRNQAVQAAAMYDEVERVMGSGDPTKIDRTFADIKERFSSTTYAQQAGLLVAKQHFSTGNLEGATAALKWVAEQSSDEGYQSIAKLRLAGLMMDARTYDDALTLLGGKFSTNFAGLVSDRKGDIFLLQGKKSEAVVAFQNAYSSFDERTDYRRLVEVKLNSLGADPQAMADGVAALASSSLEGKK